MELATFFSPRGRLARLPYLGLFIVQSLVFSGVAHLLTNSSLSKSPAAVFIYLVFALFGAYWSFIPFIKRFHDLNKSGWNVLWLIIPLINIIILLILLFKAGTDGFNDYDD